MLVTRAYWVVNCVDEKFALELQAIVDNL